VVKTRIGISTFWLNLDQIYNGGSLRWGNRQMQVSLVQMGKTVISTCIDGKSKWIEKVDSLNPSYDNVVNL
jgi:hypothetical protein